MTLQSSRRFLSVSFFESFRPGITSSGGKITAATDIDYIPVHREYHFDKSVYDKRVYYGFGKADPTVELRMGPNITDWPQMSPLAENLLVELAAVLHDPVTTTDELIPPARPPLTAPTPCSWRSSPSPAGNPPT